MGSFEENICNCCFCPMQHVLKQFIGEEVTVNTILTFINGTLIVKIDAVEKFNIIGTNQSNEPPTPICVPISKMLGFIPMNPKPINLIPNKKNNKGDCVCLEEAVTNKLKVNDTVDIGIGASSFTVTAVGEGVVVLVSNDDGSQNIVSTCTGIQLVQSVMNSQVNSTVKRL
ncbi:hypothetical protein [Chengkuizengella axinellae]|uniref:Uncharacterized protein n=1 Tax=Chengkuizengella axinellae TaxID=3064388 RepID=A0ABT9J1X2_9BACL|nr:hypothetical protein [Chengkuizengella sp. 2205SS18-9]MDP5275568.1 hypothetical protein [Chengkuizengella sp. 2205SS18-9]